MGGRIFPTPTSLEANSTFLMAGSPSGSRKVGSPDAICSNNLSASSGPTIPSRSRPLRFRRTYPQSPLGTINARVFVQSTPRISRRAVSSIVNRSGRHGRPRPGNPVGIAARRRHRELPRRLRRVPFDTFLDSTAWSIPGKQMSATCIRSHAAGRKHHDIGPRWKAVKDMAQSLIDGERKHRIGWCRYSAFIPGSDTVLRKPRWIQKPVPGDVTRTQGDPDQSKLFLAKELRASFGGALGRTKRMFRIRERYGSEGRP